jgi:predicted nucleotidyltransferase
VVKNNYKKSNTFLINPDTAMEKSDLKKIKEMLSPVFIENKVKKAVLFGSFSKSSQTRKSDLDLMIITETDKRFFDRYEQFDKIYEIINDRAVDMLIYTARELSSISHRPFIKRILSEGETIYES